MREARERRTQSPAHAHAALCARTRTSAGAGPRAEGRDAPSLAAPPKGARDAGRRRREGLAPACGAGLAPLRTRGPRRLAAHEACRNETSASPPALPASRARRFFGLLRRTPGGLTVSGAGRCRPGAFPPLKGLAASPSYGARACGGHIPVARGWRAGTLRLGPRRRVGRASLRPCGPLAAPAPRFVTLAKRPSTGAGRR